MNLVTLHETLGGVIAQKHTGKISGAMLLDQNGRAQRQSRMASEEIIQGRRPRGRGWPAIVR